MRQEAMHPILGRVLEITCDVCGHVYREKLSPSGRRPSTKKYIHQVFFSDLPGVGHMCNECLARRLHGKRVRP